MFSSESANEPEENAVDFVANFFHAIDVRKKVSDGFHECPYDCGFTSKYKWNANRHVQEIHGYINANGVLVKKEFICSTCGTSNSNKANFSKHATNCMDARCIVTETQLC